MLIENLNIIRKCFTLKRLINAIKAYLSYGVSLILKKPIVWGIPPILMIEPTNICNLKCPLCPSGNGSLKRKKGYMEFSLFKKLIDEIKEKTSMVVLWNQGEPFLNKEFLRMVKYASSQKLFTLVSSNLNIMPSAEEIIDSGLDSIIVSLDGVTQETYNQYRVNGSLEKVMENVKKLIKAKKKANSKIPYIRWQFLVMKHNENEISEIRRLAKEIGVDKLELKSIQIYSKEDIENFLPKNPKYRRYNISDGDFELKFTFKNRCKRLWTDPVVNWNGEISVCCFDKDIQFKVGNIKEKSLQSIWKNSAFQKMRSGILKNRAQFDMCRNCLEGAKLRIEEKSMKGK